MFLVWFGQFVGHLYSDEVVSRLFNYQLVALLDRAAVRSKRGTLTKLSLALVVFDGRKLPSKQRYLKRILYFFIGKKLLRRLKDHDVGVGEIV